MASTQPTLSATYTSADNAPFAVSLPLGAPEDSTTLEGKTKYLSKLRQSVASLQDRVNKELTARMEEDKAREGAGSGEGAGAGATRSAAGGTKLVDDEKEEENYGEEVQEEE